MNVQNIIVDSKAKPITPGSRVKKTDQNGDGPVYTVELIRNDGLVNAAAGAENLLGGWDPNKLLVIST